jgi:hypothetical protein
MIYSRQIEGVCSAVYSALSPGGSANGGVVAGAREFVSRLSGKVIVQRSLTHMNP